MVRYGGKEHDKCNNYRVPLFLPDSAAWFADTTWRYSMVSQTIFVISFIWIGVSVVFGLGGAWVGFDAKATSSGIKEYWARPSNGIFILLSRRIFISIAYLGLVLPATKPLFGFSISILGFVLLGAIK